MGKKTDLEGTLERFKETWKRAMSQIGAGRSAKAAIAELSSELSELQDLVAEAAKLHGIALSADAALGPKPTIAAGAMTTRKRLTQEERSKLIKEIATEVAAARGGQTTVWEVDKAIEAKGIDLDTPVAPTMIGAVLNRSDDWKRLDKGTYQYVGRKS